MDLFDDFLPAAPAVHARPVGKFAPKAKSKQPPQKKTSGSNHDAAGASVSSMPAEQSIGSKNSTQVELPNLEEKGSHQQVTVEGDTAALADDLPETPALSEVESDLNFTNLSKSACEADPVASEVGPNTDYIPETNHRGGVEEPPKHGKGSLLEGNIQSSSNFRREQEAESGKFELDPFSDVLPDSGTKTAFKFQPKIKPRPRVGTTPAIASASSNVMIGGSVELPTSCTNEAQSFRCSGDDSGGLNRSTDLPIPTPDIPFAEDNSCLATDIPSQLDSLNAMPSQNAEIFSGLDSLGDFPSQSATDTGKPVLQSFNEKGREGNFVISASGVCDATQVEMCPEYTIQDSLPVDEAAILNEDDTRANNRRSETEEVADLSPGCPVNDVLDYQFLKSGTDPTSEIPVHEELTNAADNPTLAELLQADVTREKEDANGRKKDGIRLSSLRKHRSSSVREEDKGVKTSRQPKKQASRKPVSNSVDENDDEDLDPPYNPTRDELEENDDEHEENDDEFDVDYSSKKKTALNSTKKPVAKNGKTSKKRKKDNEDVEETTKEPPKKFSHSTRRKKRCVNKSLLEIPEDELDPQTLPLKDIILLAEYRERLAKKGATTSKTSSTNQSGGDPFHEDGANIEEEIFGSEDGREPGDDQASESIPLAPSLFNYQSFMNKAPRGKWSKQDTELFYEAVRQFGTDFSMIQQLFPDRTRHQIKLKYKKEERQHPLQLSDAVNNRAKDHTHFKLVIERLQQASTKADQDPGREASDFMTAEEVEDLAPGTNEDVAPTAQEAVAATAPEVNVKDQEDSMANHSPDQSDDSDDDFQRWAQYKSEY